MNKNQKELEKQLEKRVKAANKANKTLKIFDKIAIKILQVLVMLIITLAILIAFSQSVKAQTNNPIDRVYYTDPITHQSYQGWEAIGHWTIDNGEYVASTIIISGFTIAWIHDERNNPTCKIRWWERRRAKRQFKKRRR